MRRTWIKIYANQVLYGTIKDELAPAERWIWFGLLCLAADSAYDGQISITQRKGYTIDQLAELLDVTEKQMQSALDKMVKFEKIKLLSGNVIKITKWAKYQSEYSRQKQYRRKGEYDCFSPQEKSYNQKLQPKVTTKSYAPELDKEKEKELDKEIRKNKDIKKAYDFFKNKIPIPEEKIEEEFDEFWKHWPIKASKQDALVAFKALRKKVGFNLIWASASGYSQVLRYKSNEENFDQAPMYMGTFLRKERWFDYYGFEYKARL